MLLVCAALLMLAACGGGGNRGAGTGYKVGGTVSSLTGSGLVLDDNGGDNLSVSSNGAFSFATALASGATYKVTVLTQPADPVQNCTVTNGSGTVSGTVTGVSIACTTSYEVGGTVSGLAGTGLVLRNNGVNDLTVSSNGSFSFATALASGTAYNVTVLTQPANPSQNCAVANGIGTVSGSVTDVAIKCTTYYGVGGTVLGLAGSGLVLRDNGGDNLSVSSNGVFSFATALASGATYNVTVLSQPTYPNQNCIVANGNGTASVNITGVAVTCTVTYRIGGTVSGLTGSGFVLRNNGTDDLMVSANGAFSFATALASGATYNVTVSTQPVSPAQNCIVSSGSASATITNADVTTVTVVCTTIGRFAYVANRSSDSVSAYTINPATGSLTAIANSAFASGTRPMSVAVDPSGKFAYVANSGSNNVSAYAIDVITGALTPVPNSPFAAGTYPQSVVVDPSGNLLYVANAYSYDVSAFTINRTSGALSAVAGSPFASGQFSYPESVTVDPSGRFAYTANNGGSNISAYTINAITGVLTPVTNSPFSAGTGPLSVSVAPDGEFAYVANVASDNVSAYMVDATTGALTPIANSPFAVGTRPDYVAVSPSGKFVYVAHDISSDVSVHLIDFKTGALTVVANGTYPTGTSPECVSIDPSGKFIYIANGGSNNVSAYSIDGTTGALTPVSGSPFSSGTGPFSVAVSK
jgi:6-phosphogluconolactonase (cycloisomerase 2 family)